MNDNLNCPDNLFYTVFVVGPWLCWDVFVFHVTDMLRRTVTTFYPPHPYGDHVFLASAAIAKQLLHFVFEIMPVASY